jgi:hypothetical protein
VVNDRRGSAISRKALLLIMCGSFVLIAALAATYAWRSTLTPEPGIEIEDFLYIMLRKDGYIRRPDWLVEIHVNSIEGRTLKDAIFKRRANGGGFDVIASAKEAELRVDSAHKQILVHMRECNFVQPDGGIAFVHNKIWPIEIPPGFTGEEERVRGR